MLYRAALATLLAMLVTASDVRSIRDPEALVVHEWGTFTSIAGEDGEALAWSPQLGSDDLPCFVERFRRYRGKGFVRGTVRMETPVLYFYAPRETSVNVSVGFRNGLITEWFPRADVSPTELVADDGLVRPGFMGRARWTGVRVLPGSREDFPTQGRSSHYYLARQTDAAPVEVGGAREKFLFYRGVANIRVPITARPEADGSVHVSSRNGAPLGTVILFERRGDRTGFEMRASAGASVSFPRPPLTGNVEELMAALEASLVRSGLYAREAKAMVDTWRDSWFEEGTRVFYVLREADVDAMLPLEIEPRPASVARVFVGRMEVITPATRAAVEAALVARDAARLRPYGRFLLPISERILADQDGPLDRPAPAPFPPSREALRRDLAEAIA
jgi:hypothetical protein